MLVVAALRRAAGAVRSVPRRLRPAVRAAERRALVRHRRVRARRAEPDHVRRAHRARSSASPRRSSGCTIGGLLGVISAYWGGKVDLLLERLMDILLAFPQLILALAIASILGPAVQNVVIAISIPVIPRVARVVRAAALSVKENVYVEAVQALGASRPSRHPAAHHPERHGALHHHADRAARRRHPGRGGAVSYLGLGAAEPTPSWGLMLSGSAPLVRREGAVDRALPGHRHQPRRVRLQPLRRLAARRARPEAARALSPAAGRLLLSQLRHRPIPIGEVEEP